MDTDLLFPLPFGNFIEALGADVLRIAEAFLQPGKGGLKAVSAPFVKADVVLHVDGHFEQVAAVLLHEIKKVSRAILSSLFFSLFN